jgi:TPR repeat protein
LLIAEAVRWYRAAAAAGDGEANGALEQLRARSALADALLARDAGDFGSARAKLEALAKKNDLEALYWRGVMEQSGEGGVRERSGRGAQPRSGVSDGQRRRGARDAEAALERLYFERRFGAPPSADVDGAPRAMAQQMRPLAAGILRPLAAAGNADAQYWLATPPARPDEDGFPRT